MNNLSCFLLVCLLIGIDFLLFWAFQLLWNWLVPLFWASAPILTYWQAAGVVILLHVVAWFFKSKS